MSNSSPPDASTDNRTDGPSGIGGWLALLILLMMLIGPLLGAGRLFAEIGLTEQKHSEFLAFLRNLDDDSWNSYKMAVGWTFAGVAALSIFGGWRLLRLLDWTTVRETIMILWITGPIATFVLAWVIPKVVFGSVLFESVVDEVAVPVFTSGIAVAIWTAYLLNSRRVRNTYQRVQQPVPEEERSSGDAIYSPASPDQDRKPWTESAGRIERQTGILVQRPNMVQAEPWEAIAHKRIQIAPEPAQHNSIAETPSVGSAPNSETYAQAWNEIETGEYDKGIWAQAFAACEGDPARTKAQYLQLRVQQLHTATQNQEKLERRKKAILDFHEEMKPLLKKYRSHKYVVSIDAPIFSGRTRLGEAVFWGRRELVLDWLAQGANPSATDTHKNTAKDIAIANQDEKMITLLTTAMLWWRVAGEKIVEKKERTTEKVDELELLQQEITIARRELGLNTPLTLDELRSEKSLECQQLFTEIVGNNPRNVNNWLLRGAYPFARSAHGRTAIEVAGGKGNPDVDYALQRMAWYWDKKVQTLLNSPVNHVSRASIARGFLERMYGVEPAANRDDVSNALNSLLDKAAKAGDGVLVRCLLVGFPQQFAKSYLLASAMQIAREHGHESVLETLKELAPE